jgi:hypothetical protein
MMHPPRSDRLQNNRLGGFMAEQQRLRAGVWGGHARVIEHNRPLW